MYRLVHKMLLSIRLGSPGYYQPQGGYIVDLSSYKWKHRLLLIFASSDSDGNYKEQLRRLEGLELELEDRDLLLGKFPEYEAGELDGTPISVADAEKLRYRFGVDPDAFVILLVGKDGGEKFRAGEPVSVEEIFRRIDAMPMRQREMRERR